MIQPLTIGQHIFATNLIQGPLAGVSSAPFRRLIWQFSQPAYTTTEMISCKTLLHQTDEFLQRFIYKDELEGTLCFQLSGNDPYELAEATKKATALGADLIDLNCGCPVKKIRGKRAGSHLLSDATRLYALMHAMKQNTNVPISIKIRVDGASADRFNHDIAKAVNDAGIDALVVHGRHWTEHYETACRYEEIGFFADIINVPVIGNGDVACIASLKKMLATGCAGVMIGRALVGQPWLIQQLITEMRNEDYNLPTKQETGELFVNHVAGLVQLLKGEKFALQESRKLAKYYARRLELKNEFCLAMNACVNWQDFQQLCRVYFTD